MAMVGFITHKCIANRETGLDGRPNLAIGSVLKAWQAEDNSVKVLCSIDQKTDLADHVRQNVLNRQLPDLSLSHSYEMFLDGMCF